MIKYVISNYFDMTEWRDNEDLSQAYKVIRELNEELKQKGIRVQRGKVAIEYFNERYKIA